jgi:monoamine oxidase
MRTLLDEDFGTPMLFEGTWEWQATMMQPVGGMDQIPYAFAKSLGSIIRYNCPVTSIRKSPKGVAVSYPELGASKEIEASYCVIALPFEIRKKIPNDLSPDVKRAVDGSTPVGFFKIAWESRRFWEKDYNIYGGISYSVQGVTPIWPVWYPSARLMSPTGIVVSGYWEEQGSPLCDMPLTQKFEASRHPVEMMHPGHGSELKNPVYVGWRRVKWNEGSWIKTFGGGEDGYDRVIAGDAPIFFAGDTVSHMPGWQEGAALSARHAVTMISERVKATRSGINLSPRVIDREPAHTHRSCCSPRTSDIYCCSLC